MGVQIVGFSIGSTADVLGPTILLLLITLFMGAATLSVKLIPPLDEIENTCKDGIVSQIKRGLVIACADKKIRTPI